MTYLRKTSTRQIIYSFSTDNAQGTLLRALRDETLEVFREVGLGVLLSPKLSACEIVP